MLKVKRLEVGLGKQIYGEFIITYNYHNFHDQIIQGFMILRKIAENDNNNNKKKTVTLLIMLMCC
jgi:hypothetical protein